MPPFPPSPPTQTSPQPRFPFFELSGYSFCYLAFIGVFLPYFALYLKSLSFSAWDIGVLMSQMQLMRLFAPYLWSIVADRHGHRIDIIRLSGCLSLLAFLPVFFSTSFTVLLAALAMLSFFWVAAAPLFETLIFDHLRENAARYSRIRLWGSIGYIVTVLATGALLDRLPLPSLLWLLLAMLALVVVFGFVVPEAPIYHAHGETPAIGAVLRQSRVRALLASSFAMWAAHGPLNIFYAIYLSGHGYSKSLIGGLVCLGVVAEIAVFYFMARIMRHFSLRTILLACFVAAALRFVMIGWGVDRLSLLVPAQLMHGLTFGAFHSATISAINRWFPGCTRTRGQALLGSIGTGAGGLLGGLVSALTWDHLGAALTFSLGSAYALAGLALMRWIRERDPDDRSRVGERAAAGR